MCCLVIGPWVGEFGWELMSWQGRARKVAQSFDKVVACSRQGHELLYADFATRYISHRIDGLKDCYKIQNLDLDAYRKLDIQLDEIGGTRLRPGTLFPLSTQMFIKFGRKPHVASYDVLAHARGEVGKRAHHAYPADRWDRLVGDLIGQGITVAAIGTEAYLPYGALDLRGLPLSHVADAMATCRLVIGPSSGPMHLASLCGAKHVVWTDQGYYSAVGGTNRDRYERFWNPLSTPVRVVDEFGWHPPVEKILEIVLEELGRSTLSRERDSL